MNDDRSPLIDLLSCVTCHVHGNVLLVYAFLNVTPEERELLETTARSLLKLQHDFADRISGMDILLQEMVRDRDLLLPRLKLKADLLRMKGAPSEYLESFVRNLEADS